MPTRCAIAFLLLIVVPASARAQVSHPAGIGGTIAATSMDSGTSLSFAGSFTYRFNSVVGLELEVTAVPKLDSPFPNDPVVIQNSTLVSVGSSLSSIQLFPTPTVTNSDGRAVIFANNVRVNIPTTSTRLEPYFVAGGGVASVRHTADFSYIDFLRLTPTPGIPIPAPLPRAVQRVTSSTVDLALTLGGGLSVRIASQLSIEADLRLFRLLGEEDRNVGRFGVGARYRF
jgi:opacity protein-like surface antigen